MSSRRRRVQSARQPSHGAQAGRLDDLAIDCTPASPAARQQDLLDQYASGQRPPPPAPHAPLGLNRHNSASDMSGTHASSSDLFSRPNSGRRAPSARRRVPNDARRRSEAYLMFTRTEEERVADPDRINLDHRNLDRCPFIRNEPALRLLNLQHNAITAIEHLDHLETLIFLDLYDNRIQRISGLDRLRSLRVLMLGRNSISSLHGLAGLMHLDVLDLHANAITSARGLENLRSLRVLNLASNLIRDMTPLKHLGSLVELNLSRNQIPECLDLPKCTPHLQRLFFSDNLLQSSQGILGHTALAELSLDGNAGVTGQSMYRERTITALPALRMLDNRRVSEEERRMAGINVRKMRDKKAQEQEAERRIVERDNAIRRAQEQWRQQRAQQRRPSSRSSTSPAEKQHNDNDRTPPRKAEARTTSPASPKRGRRRSTTRQTLDTAQQDTDGYLWMEGDAAYVYGNLDALLQRNTLPSSCRSLRLRYLDVDALLCNPTRVRRRVPGLNALHLEDCNVCSLTQIAGLVQLALRHLTIAPEEPLCSVSFWREYTIYRLGPCGLKTLNGDAIALMEVSRAQQAFAALDTFCKQLPTPIALSRQHFPAPIPQQDLERFAERLQSRTRAAASSGGGGASFPSNTTHASTSRRTLPRQQSISSGFGSSALLLPAGTVSIASAGGAAASGGGTTPNTAGNAATSSSVVRGVREMEKAVRRATKAVIEEATEDHRLEERVRAMWRRMLAQQQQEQQQAMNGARG